MHLVIKNQSPKCNVIKNKNKNKTTMECERTTGKKRNKQNPKTKQTKMANKQTTMKKPNRLSSVFNICAI